MVDLVISTYQSAPDLKIRTIAVGDLWRCLRAGFDDFMAAPSHMIFLCVVYPLFGLILTAAASGTALHLVFPLVSGFALVGPAAATVFYEVSRQRESGLDHGWTSALGLIGSPSIMSILGGAVLLTLILLAWVGTAQAIFDATMGPVVPATIADFASRLLTTSAGLWLTVVGTLVGFLFAVIAFTVSVVSFPLIIDRHVGLLFAMTTSARCVARNPSVMAIWALTLAAGLLLGALPLFVGLTIVLPVLGHASWHLYRAVLPSGEERLPFDAGKREP